MVAVSADPMARRAPETDERCGDPSRLHRREERRSHRTRLFPALFLFLILALCCPSSADRGSSSCDAGVDGVAASDECRFSERDGGMMNSDKGDETTNGDSAEDADLGGRTRRRKGAWKWIPEAEHRCNITRVTASELERRFGFGGLPPLYPHPLIIRDDPGRGEPRRNAKFADMTSLENLASNLPPDFNVTLSSSNSFSAHRRTIPLTQYLNETVNGETRPDQLSNETWYLFGETYGPGWRRLLGHFDLPPCRTCTRDLSALAFGVGNRGSGVQWHTHGPGFSESVHGRKHWVLYPPDRRPEYDADYASRHWMEVAYAAIEKGEDLPHECTLMPGDMVYFPDQWHHATINLDPYTVFVSTFTTEHI